MNELEVKGKGRDEAKNGFEMKTTGHKENSKGRFKK